MARQSIPIPASWFSIEANAIRVTPPENSRPAINDALTPSSNPTRVLQAFAFFGTGHIAAGRARIDFEDGQTGSGSNLDISDAFESTGSISATVGSLSITANLDGADMTEPYSWLPSNAAEVRAFTDAVLALSTIPDSTLVIDDGVLPNASAPTVTINAIPAGNEGTDVELSATLEGGVYDEIDYDWSVSGGTLNDNTSATPTLTRPDVTVDTDFTADLTVTARGTGTNANDNTSDTESAAQVSFAVNNVPVITTDTDTIRILSAASPGTPAGGTTQENHLPTGWTRNALAATGTQAVWESTRTRTFTDGAFTSATAWGAPTIAQARLLALGDFPEQAGINMDMLALYVTGAIAGNEVVDVGDNRGEVLDGDNVIEYPDNTTSIVGRFQVNPAGSNIILNNRGGTGVYSTNFTAPGGAYNNANIYLYIGSTLITLPPAQFGNAGGGFLNVNIPAANQSLVQTLRTSGTRFILGVGRAAPQPMLDTGANAVSRPTAASSAVTKSTPAQKPAGSGAAGKPTTGSARAQKTVIARKPTGAGTPTRPTALSAAITKAIIEDKFSATGTATRPVTGAAGIAKQAAGGKEIAARAAVRPVAGAAGATKQTPGGKETASGAAARPAVSSAAVAIQVAQGKEVAAGIAGRPAASAVAVTKEVAQGKEVAAGAASRPSASSAALGATTAPGSVPGEPTLDSAELQSNQSDVLLEYTAPVDDGGLPILYYEYRVDGGQWRRAAMTVSGLTPVTTDAQDMTDDFVPADWTDTPQGVNLTWPYEWVSRRVGRSMDWGKFSIPALWGRWSEDGLSVEYIYTRTTEETPLPVPATTAEEDATDDFVPSGYTDTPQGVNNQWPFEWVSERTGRSGNWSKFGLPVLQWRLGDPGADGAGLELVFQRTQTDTQPATPATTEEQDATDDFVPQGWTDDQQGVNPTSQFEWVSKRVGSTGAWGKFNTPQKWAVWSFDGAGIEYIYRRTQTDTALAAPTTTEAEDAADDFVPTGWTDDPTGVTPSLPFEWVSKRTGSTGAWGKFTTPVLQYRYSEDGAGIEQVYVRTNTENPPPRPATNNAEDATNEFVPAGWTDEPQGITATQRFEWVSIRTGTSGNWGKFSAPALWTRWSDDGVGQESVYRRTPDMVAPNNIVTNVTQDATDDFVPANWTDSPQGVTAGLPNEWIATRRGRSGAWGKFSEPALFSSIDALTIARTASWFFVFVSANVAVAIENLSTSDDWPSSAVAAANAGTPGENRPGDIVTLYHGDIASTRTWNSVTGKWVALASFVNGQLVVHGGISADNLAAQMILTNQLWIGTGRNIKFEARTGQQPAITVHDNQATQVERVRIGQLGSDPTDWGLIIRDAMGNDIITQDGLGLGVVGDANITGTISAMHISGDVINVVTLYTGSGQASVPRQVGFGNNSDTETIALSGDLDDFGMLFMITGSGLLGIEISDIPTTGIHEIETITDGLNTARSGVRRNAGGDSLTLYVETQRVSGSTPGPAISLTARRILGVKGPASTPVPSTDTAGTVSLSTTTPRVGDTITATLSDPDNPTSITYQWLNNGSNISGATSRSYTARSSDQNDRLSCRVTYNDDFGNGKSVTSAQTSQVAAAIADPTLTLDDSSTVTITEGNSRVFGFSLSNSVSGNVSVSCSLSGSGLSFRSGSSDTSETVVISAGSTSGSVRVYARPDSDTDDETGTLSISTSSNLVDASNNSDSVTINTTDDDMPEPVDLRLDDSGTVNIEEGESREFDFELSAAVSGSVSVTCTLTGGGAGTDVSFRSSTGDTSETVVISAGSTSGSIRVYARDADSNDNATLRISTTSALVTGDQDDTVNINPTEPAPTEEIVYEATITVEQAVSADGSLLEGYAAVANIYGHTGPLGSRNVNNPDTQIDLIGVTVFRSAGVGVSGGTLSIQMTTGSGGNSDNTFTKFQIATGGGTLTWNRTALSYSSSATIAGQTGKRWRVTNTAVRLSSGSFTVRFLRDV